MIRAAAEQWYEVTLERVKEVLLSSLGDDLREAEALGICGSLARSKGFSEHSDIDVFVIVQEKEPGGATDKRWWQRIQWALEPFGRDVTVLVYSVAGLKAVSNWYVLRLAAEAILIYDQANIAGLFEQIVQAARQAGLTQEMIDGRLVWTASPERAGSLLEITVL
jgi:predicted nucleotidyltransferase